MNPAAGPLLGCRHVRRVLQGVAGTAAGTRKVLPIGCHRRNRSHRLCTRAGLGTGASWDLAP